MGKETLEDAAESKWSLEKAQEFAVNKFKSKLSEGTVTWELILEVLKIGVLTGHKFGTKWQAERSYREEDMITFIDWSKSTNQEKSDYELKCLLAGVVIDSKTLFNMWAKQLKKNN